MTKRFVTALSTIFLALGAYAEANFMTLEKIDGTKISFNLAENPVITYENNNLVINKDAKTTYSFEDVKNYHFTETNQSGEDMYSANILRIIKVDEETINVQNAQAGTVVFVTSANGIVVAKSKADVDGNVTIKLPNSTGVYILTSGTQSFKIIRK